jgi:ATP-dependent DNA ligase
MSKKYTTLDLIQQPKAFNHPEWLFEIKHDGFRSLAYIEKGKCKLTSRNEFDYTRSLFLVESQFVVKTPLISHQKGHVQPESYTRSMPK